MLQAMHVTMFAHVKHLHPQLLHSEGSVDCQVCEISALEQRETRRTFVPQEESSFIQGDARPHS